MSSSNMIAIAESTPGPIAINSATYIGYHIAGVPGRGDGHAWGVYPFVCHHLPHFPIL